MEIELLDLTVFMEVIHTETKMSPEARIVDGIMILNTGVLDV